MEGHFDAVWTLTQNVDGLHRRAGSQNVLDVHGDLHDLACTRCDYACDRAGLLHDCDVPPLCPRCRAIVRPAVVLFGEELPAAKMARLWREIEVGFDVVFSIGTSSLFPYIAAPVLMARASGIPTVEINPERTAVTSAVDIKIAGGAAEVMDRLWALSWKSMTEREITQRRALRENRHQPGHNSPRRSAPCNARTNTRPESAPRRRAN